MKNFIISLCLFAISISASAKELTLNLTVQTQYPMSVYYKFLGDNTVYGQGKFDNLPNNATRSIAVNRIPDDQSVLVQVYKMTAGKLTEINDPCEIRLDNPNLTANITVGIIGNPDTHGSFNCDVSAD